MTPAILLVLSTLTIHFRKRLFDVLSFTSMPSLGKESYIEGILLSIIEVCESIVNGYGNIINKQINKLFIKINDRDCTTCNVFSNSLEYPKTTDGLVYLTD